MDNIGDKLITVGVGLGLLAGTWFIWFLSGVVNNFFNTKKWSWKRMLEDIAKTFVMGLAMLAWVALAEVLDWYTTQVGMDISTLLDGASTTGLIGIICGGSGYYIMKAFRNFGSFIGTEHVAKQVGEANYEAVADNTMKAVKDIIEHFAPAVEPDQPVKALTKAVARKALDEAQFGASGPVAVILQQLMVYAEKKAFLKEDGTSGVYRGQCTQVPAFVYNQAGVTGAMGNGKDVVKNLIALGAAEPCGEEPGAIASADDGSEYGHTWVSLGNGFLIEQNAHVAGTVAGNFGVGTVYSCRVGKVNDWNRGRITYCRIKALSGGNSVAETPKAQPAPAPVQSSTSLEAGDKVNVTKYVDVNGTRLAKLQNTPYTVYQVRSSDNTVVLKSDDGDIYARIPWDNIQKIN